MSACDELPECPLCMEVFEIDDINFFPCTCGYQICRFCWHRIRTNENGLCPACRKAYPEDPAQFKPLTDDEVHKIKKDRRQKESQRKQKSAESRKHLANVRVVQKNLVFVVGLSARLTDPDTLKRHEYFGKFGKIHKVVINPSTSYVGSQGPSASAYVTYYRPEDALTAIRVVNNLQIDGRTLKVSLGTTKYCSHFLKGTQCLKTDCMYLHDYGDENASFTKEDIQQSKHVQYEQKLHEMYSSPNAVHPTSGSPDSQALTIKTQFSKQPETSPPSSSGELSPVQQPSPNFSPTTPPPAPPQPQSDTASTGGLTSIDSPREECNQSVATDPQQGLTSRSETILCNGDLDEATSNGISSASSSSSYTLPSMSQDVMRSTSVMTSRLQTFTSSLAGAGGKSSLLFGGREEHLSLFSETGFPSSRTLKQSLSTAEQPQVPPPAEPEILETMSVQSSTNWTEAFGFTSNDNDAQDDDLGFDPWDVSARGLADMMENERASSSSAAAISSAASSSSTFKTPADRLIFPLRPPPPTPTTPQLNGFFQPPSHLTAHLPPPPLLHNAPYQHMQWSKTLPPGFMPPNGYMGQMGHSNSTGVQQHFMPPPPQLQNPPTRSKMLNLMQVPQTHQMPLGNNFSGPPDVGFYGGSSPSHPSRRPDHMSSVFHPTSHVNHPSNQGSDEYNTQEWQEGLRALLPNINISFGSQSAAAQQTNGGASSLFGGGLGGGSTGLGGGQPFPLNGSMPSQHLSRVLQNMDKGWSNSLSSHSMPDLSFDPAIVNTGGLAEANEEPPHWMASLQHLTDDHHTGLGGGGAGGLFGNASAPPSSHPLLNSWMSGSGVPPTTARYPPPGFTMNSSSTSRQNSESQNFNSEHRLPTSS